MTEKSSSTLYTVNQRVKLEFIPLLPHDKMTLFGINIVFTCLCFVKMSQLRCFLITIIMDLFEEKFIWKVFYKSK